MPRQPGTYAIFETTEGQIVCRLFETDAPITTKNFIDLAEGTAKLERHSKRKRRFRTALQRHHFSSGHPRFHDSRRRSQRHRHGRSRVQIPG